MSRNRLKLIIWALTLLAALSIAAGGLRLLGRVVSSTSEGADPATALNIVPNVPPSLNVALAWAPDASRTGREPDPATRTKLGGAYLRALLHLDESYRNGNASGLVNGFTGPALPAVQEAQRLSTSGGRRIARAELSHTLELTFFSADGTVAGFRDHAVPVIEIALNPDGTTAGTLETVAEYDVVMTIVEGNWLVRQLVRVDARPVAAGLEPARTRPGFVGRQGDGLALDGEPFTISGVNYYPAASPWERFWPEYDPAVIDRDFAEIRDLGGNTVRIFLPFAQVGGADPDPRALDDLADLLDRA
ncbi:MAG: hypothetical protein ACR2J8_05110, partial [Thermomicrobiales bacterium]